METSLSHRYWIDDIEIDASESSVRRGGEEHRLRPKTFQVLLYLIENRDRTVSKDELLETVWPSTTVTEDTLVQSIGDLRKAVGDDPRDPWFIRTIPRVGYRLIAPVDGERVRRAEIEETQSVEISLEEREEAGWRQFLPYLSAVLVVVALSAVAAVWMMRPDKPAPSDAFVPSRPLITNVAVARFSDQAGKRDLDWLRSGLRSMLMTRLANSPRIHVISRDLGGRSVDTWIAAARRSGAHRLIAGTYGGIGDRVRIDAQLYDVSTGRMIGGASIVSSSDSLLGDVDILSSELATSLGSPLSAGKGGEGFTDSLDAYREYEDGMRAAEGLHTAEAIRSFERAIAIDPQFAMAHARIGYAFGVTQTMIDRAKPYFDKALALPGRLAERERMHVLGWRAIADGDYAAAIDRFRLIVSHYPADVEAYERLGRLLIGEGRLAEAIDIFRRGLVLDPGSPELHNSLGTAESYLGNHAAAIAYHQRYVSLLPTEPNSHDSLGLSHHWAGDYRRALESYERALQLSPDFEIGIVHRANTYWAMGRNREAIAELSRYVATAAWQIDRQRGYRELFFLYRGLRDLEHEAEMVRLHSLEDPGEVLLRTLLAVDRRDFAAAARLVAGMPSPSGNRGKRETLRLRHYLLAEVARVSGNTELAIDHARNALRHHAPIYFLDDLEDLLGDTLHAAGRTPEAITEYRRILRLNENRARTRYKLARALESIHRSADASVEYQRFLKTWSDADADAPEIVDAKARLSGVRHSRTDNPEVHHVRIAP